MAVAADEVFRRTMTPEQIARSDARARVLLAECQTLQELRRARELTQSQLASFLGKKQVTIAQLEKRADMLLSTLRSTIEAMGGRLDLVVQFPDREPVVLAGLSSEDAPPRARRPGRAAGAARSA